eukprot:6213606-Pleurochrysis_carterae.AAC.3
MELLTTLRPRRCKVGLALAVTYHALTSAQCTLSVKQAYMQCTPLNSPILCHHINRLMQPDKTTSDHEACLGQLATLCSSAPDSTGVA